MHALRQELLPPSGVEFAACLKFTPSTLSDAGSSSSQAGRTLFNVVVARSSLLRIFEVREEPAPVSAQKEDEKERRASVCKGTEAVEGEVEMDGTGDGFVNVGTVKVNTLRGNELFCRRTRQQFYPHSPTPTPRASLLLRTRTLC